MANLITLANLGTLTGDSPVGDLLIDANGDLFGTAGLGGADNYGTVFELPLINGGYTGTPLALVSFGPPEGRYSPGGLLMDSAGDLFGTLHDRFITGDGGVYEIANTASGYQNTAVAGIPLGSGFIGGGLVRDSAGNLLGTTLNGGPLLQGSIFEVAATAGGYASTPATLASFSGTNGSEPSGDLMIDAAGNLIGTTQTGGAGSGTVFELARSGAGYASTPATLINFNGGDGATPSAGLVADAAGDLFGTTASGGAGNAGTVFEIPFVNGQYATTPVTLVSFNGGDGSDPVSDLIVDAAGDLFGTTASSADGSGTVFEVPRTPSGYAGAPTVLATLSSASASDPTGGLVADANGDLFGTAQKGGGNGGGIVFEITGGGFLTSLPLVTITGAVANQSVLDVAPISPFTGVVIADTGANQTEAVTVTLSAAANGVLSNPGSGNYNSATGVWSVSGSPAAVTQAIDGLVFNSTPYLGQPGTTVTTGFTIQATDGAGRSATDASTSVVTTETNPPLLASLSTAQQLELIYIAYFNRSADGGGFSFWSGQNQQAQAGGQSAALALTNIANSFAPQPETIALYPFLGSANVDLNSPAGQAALTSFIAGVYRNLFDRAPDSAGQTYWVGQITSGTVGLGAAALAIANGAGGTDATEVQNKVAVAVDFTTRTAAANLGETNPLATTFATAARDVLSGVDGLSLNDASVSAAMSATTAYIANPSAGQSAASAMSAEMDAPLTISASNSVIDPGTGNASIQFLAGTTGDTLVLHANSQYQVSGFVPGTDVLDLRALLHEAAANLAGDISTLSGDLTVADQAGNALLRFDPGGNAGGSTVAVLLGLGESVTGLDTLVRQGAIRLG